VAKKPKKGGVGWGFLVSGSRGRGRTVLNRWVKQWGTSDAKNKKRLRAAKKGSRKGTQGEGEGVEKTRHFVD